MLTPEQYKIERAICDKARAIIETLWPSWHKGGCVPQEVCEHPDYKLCTNELRGRVEQYEILRDLPPRIGAYIAMRPVSYSNYRAATRWEVTTWTGDVVGHANETGRWRPNGAFECVYSYRATIGGKTYVGRGGGPGMYVNLREVAQARKAD